MEKYLSINEVLKKGQFIVNIPAIAILIIIPFLSVFLSPIVFAREYIAIGICAGMILGFILAWLWWSYTIVKWRIWAFKSTKKSDWNSLKERAIIQKLIWYDGSIFEKTEIRSKEDHLKIQKINSEIEQIESDTTKEDSSLDKIKDDPEIPAKIEYTYKRSERILSVFIPIILLVIGSYLISIDRIIIGILSLGLAFYLTDLNKIKDNWTRGVQFSISDDGIYMKKFKKFGFVTWNNTQDITVDTENGILNLGAWIKEEFYEVTLNLNDYSIGDYDEFLRKINVYLKRCLKNENYSDL